MIKNIEDVRKLYNDKKASMEQADIDTLNVLLDRDDVFLRLPMKTAIGILRFLGVSKEDVMAVYQSLISIENNMPNEYITISNRK